MPYKLCPRCGKEDRVDALVCDACGREYQTRFAAPEPMKKGQPTMVRLVLALALLTVLLTAVLLLHQFSV